jgi:hypothetical protein
MVSAADAPSVIVAKAFFHAATKLSDDDEDILPQEDGASMLSVFSLFAQLFPEHVKVKLRDPNVRSGLTRLQFNKLGYAMYAKEQSRRVPAPHAKPGNPGYGFKRARWRSPFQNADDERILRETMVSIGVPLDRCEHILIRVDEFRTAWDHERRPSRPAGPGRPRGKLPLPSPTGAATGELHDTASRSPQSLLSLLWSDAAVAAVLNPSDVATAISPSCHPSQAGSPWRFPAASAIPPFLSKSLPPAPVAGDWSRPAAGPWEHGLGLACGQQPPSRAPPAPLPAHGLGLSPLDALREDPAMWPAAAAAAAGYFPFGTGGRTLFGGLSGAPAAAAASAVSAAAAAGGGGGASVLASLSLLLTAAAAADGGAAWSSSRQHAGVGGCGAAADACWRGGDSEPPAKRHAAGCGLLHEDRFGVGGGGGGGGGSGDGGDGDWRLPGPKRDSAGGGDGGDADACPAGAGGAAGGGGKYGPQPDAEEAAGGPVNKASLRHLVD